MSTMYQIVDIKQCKKCIKIPDLIEITKRIFILFSHPETPYKILNSYKIYLFIVITSEFSLHLLLWSFLFIQAK